MFSAPASPSLLSTRSRPNIEVGEEVQVTAALKAHPQHEVTICADPENSNELLVGTMTEKLLTYALGRSVEADDMPAVRTILRGASADNYRFSSLVRGIVTSVPFQMRRAETDPGTN